MKYKNPEHFNINGDKTVEVVLRFDVGERCDADVILRNALEYLQMYTTSNVHPAWTRGINIEEF